MTRWKSAQGFTIVELIIVVAIIGILSAIVLVSYNGVTHQSRVSTVKATLYQASQAMTTYHLKNRYYPPSLVDVGDYKFPEDANIEVVSNTFPEYATLNEVQSGVLFSQVCKDLINEGKGRGENLGGGIDDYITSCNVYNHNELQIHGWDSTNFNTPVSISDITSVIDSVPAGDAWHPDQQSVVKNFYTELRDRYLAHGGIYPIESFWDSWSGGVDKEDLPEPIDTSKTEYCIQATSIKDESIVWHAIQGNKLHEGPCT